MKPARRSPDHWRRERRSWAHDRRPGIDGRPQRVRRTHPADMCLGSRVHGRSNRGLLTPLTPARWVDWRNLDRRAIYVGRAARDGLGDQGLNGFGGERKRRPWPRQAHPVGTTMVNPPDSTVRTVGSFGVLRLWRTPSNGRASGSVPPRVGGPQARHADGPGECARLARLASPRAPPASSGEKLPEIDLPGLFR